MNESIKLICHSKVKLGIYISVNDYRSIQYSPKEIHYTVTETK